MEPLSLIIPTFNEAEIIGAMSRQLEACRHRRRICHRFSADGSNATNLRARPTRMPRKN
jgi:hypothetical protein